MKQLTADWGLMRIARKLLVGNSRSTQALLAAVDIENVAWKTGKTKLLLFLSAGGADISCDRFEWLKRPSYLAELNSVVYRFVGIA